MFTVPRKHTLGASRSLISNCWEGGEFDSLKVVTVSSVYFLNSETNFLHFLGSDNQSLVQLKNMQFFQYTNENILEVFYASK